MPRRLFCLITICSLIFIACVGSVSADRWLPPPTQPELAQLPKLAAPLVIDGDLGEWTSAAATPVRATSYITVLNKPHTWNGNADSSMEFYSAWNTEGLCLAAVVADDDVYNDCEPKDMWQQDCVEIYVDGRTDKLMRPPYSPGAYQILVRPPVKDQPALAFVSERDGKIDGIKVAGKRSSSGYTIELLIPWAAFPLLTPGTGTAIGLQFALDEFDARDIGGMKNRPYMVTYSGALDLWQSPQNLTRWQLVDAVTTGSDTILGPLLTLDIPRVHINTEPMRIVSEVGAGLAPLTASARVQAANTDGKVVFDRTLKMSQMPAPWRSSRGARVDWRSMDLPDGYYTVTVTLADTKGITLGTKSRQTLLVGSLVGESIERLQKADISALAQKDPFRAAAYMGVGACLERFKRGIELKDARHIRESARELSARFEVVEKGTLPPGQWGLYDLLLLTANPDAQVVVEYPDTAQSCVGFYWGSIPLVNAYVHEYSSEAEAANVAASKKATAMVAYGRRTVSVNCPSKAVADMAAALIAANKPVKAEDVDKLRAQLVSDLAPKGVSATLPDDLHPYCGDVHMHSFFSDGKASPVGLSLQALYCFMDYHVVSDHNEIAGAVIAQGLFRKHGFTHPLIVGQEITTEWSHFNAYPVKTLINHEQSAYGMAKDAHAQGAVIQWNHPHALNYEWALSQHPKQLNGTSLDAWEHIPYDYAKWKKEGTLPTIVGSTDTHDGTFIWLERSLIFAPSPEEYDVAEAVRIGNVAALDADQPEFFYGHDDMTSLAWSTLSEGWSLKTAKAERLRRTLKSADIAGLVTESRPSKE